MSIENARNYRRVNDRIATAGSLTEEQLAGLGAEGFEAVISLLPPESPYAIPDEEQIVRRQGIGYRCIPVDFGAPRPEDFEAFARAMDESRGRKLLVHCAANYRVSVFYSLYARSRGEWTAAQVREFIGSVWEPADYSGWPDFIRKIEAGLTGT